MTVFKGNKEYFPSVEKLNSKEKKVKTHWHSVTTMPKKWCMANP